MRKAIEEVFGPKALDHALFYNHDDCLRFELSGNRPYINMFLQAYERASSIVQHLFQDVDRITVCLAFYGGETYLSCLSVFRSLKECEIRIPKSHSAWQELQEEDGRRTFICFEIEKSELPRFLWGTLANELGVRPRSQCDLYIFHAGLGVLAHPYDDRGMDVIGPNQEILKQAYRQFNEWLLDYDREYMDSCFGQL